VKSVKGLLEKVRKFKARAREKERKETDEEKLD